MAAGKQQRGLIDCPPLPGLPTDLAMLCLAKLPIDAVARCRAVSRAFASALRQYPPLGRLPQGMAAFCTRKEEDSYMTWFFLSRHPDLRSLVVPICFLKGRNDEACRNTSRLQVIGTGTPLILVRSGLQFRDHPMPCSLGAPDCSGIVEDGYLAQGPGCLQGFDVWQMKWLNPRATPWGPMPVDRWDFATAHFGNHVYFVGGEGPRAAASSAERLSLDTWTWEILPPMHRERAFRPTAFAIGGCLVVCGGYTTRGPPLTTTVVYDPSTNASGEVYDPTTNAWTLVPDMPPYDLTWVSGVPPSIAVVKDVAYAINQTLQVLVQLKVDSPSFANFEWQEVGQLPSSALEPGFGGTRLLSVQDELWAVVDWSDRQFSEVFSWKPLIDNGEPHWERLDNIRSTLSGGTDVSI